MSQSKSFQGIMVSSTFTDLIEHRESVRKAIEKLGFHPVSMEGSGANATGNVIETSLKMVGQSVAYIGVLTHRYGQTPEDVKRNPEGLSITELEFDEAMRLGLPILIFIMADDHKLTVADFEGDPAKRAKLEAFKAKAKRMHSDGKVERIWEAFSSPEDFAVKAAIAVGNLVKELSASEDTVAADHRARQEEMHAETQATLAEMMREFRQSAMGQQARDGNVSEAAVRNYLERALTEGFTEGDIRSWLPEWIEQARVAVNSGGNEDEAFRQAIADARARLGQQGQPAASQPIMDTLAKVRKRDDEAAQEALRVQRKYIEAAIEFDELELNIAGVVEKLFTWAEIEGKKDGDVARFVCQKAVGYYEAHPQSLSATPLLIARDALMAIQDRFDPTLTLALKGDVLNNLGMVLDSLGERLDGEAGLGELTEARGIYEAALEIWTRADFPDNWAGVQNNIGVVLLRLADRSGGAVRLETLASARAAFDSALEVFTREDRPDDWAMAQNNLGTVLNRLGDKIDGEAGTSLLMQARDAYEGALTVYTRDDVPVDWAMTQLNLGGVLDSLGSRLEGEAALQALSESRAAYEAALEVRTQQSFPHYWAEAQENIAILTDTLFNKTADKQYLIEGITAVESALEVYREMKSDYNIAKAERLLANLQVRLAKAED